MGQENIYNRITEISVLLKLKNIALNKKVNIPITVKIFSQRKETIVSRRKCSKIKGCLIF